MDTGLPKTFPSGPDGELKFIEIGHVAPCRVGWECPKVSPELEHESLLSDRNYRVLRLYHQIRVVGAAAVGDIDPLLADLLSIADSVYNGFERDEDRRKSDQLLVAVARTVRIA